MAQEPTDLEEMLDRIGEAADARDEVSLEDILEAIGRRSFGPLLLAAGLIIVAPVIGDIPGVPTVTGLVVLLISAQLLLKRRHFWLPRWMLRRSISSDKLHKSLGWLRKPARFVDRLIRPRLTRFVDGAWVYVIAAVSAVVALATPAMEVVPFSANGAGAVLGAFGLALIAHDGLLALIAFALAAVTAAVIVYVLVSP